MLFTNNFFPADLQVLGWQSKILIGKIGNL